jgi:hypothetical protein
MSRFIDEFCDKRGSCTNKSCKQRALASKPAPDDIAYNDKVICSKFKSDEGVVDKNKEIHLVGLWKGKNVPVNMADEPEPIQEEVIVENEDEL